MPRRKKRGIFYAGELFPEDETWLTNETDLALLRLKHRLTPHEYASIAVQIASILSRKNSGRTRRSVAKGSPQQPLFQAPRVMQGFLDSGPQLVNRTGAESTCLSRAIAHPVGSTRKRTEPRHCARCGGLLDAYFVSTHAKRHYHRGCLEHVLNTYDYRRILP